jgi:hypothetical protein
MVSAPKWDEFDLISGIHHVAVKQSRSEKGGRLIGGSV